MHIVNCMMYNAIINIIIDIFDACKLLYTRKYRYIIIFIHQNCIERNIFVYLFNDYIFNLYNYDIMLIMKINDEALIK